MSGWPPSPGPAFVLFCSVSGERGQMLRPLERRILPLVWRVAGICAPLLLLLLLSNPISAQTWSWTYETIDLPSKYPSLAIDANSNLHIAYSDNDGNLKYGFRPAGSNRWFSMVLDKQLGQFTTRITIDPSGHPQICYTPDKMKFARFDGQEWKIQEIAKDTGEIGYTCSIVIAKDGTPSVTWYQLTGAIQLHIRYATLKDNVWLARTLDFDNETGKWNTMLLDSHDLPVLCYSAWYNGELRLAKWTGKQWDFTTIDSRLRSPGEYNIGQGNSMALGPDDDPHISYYSEKALKYAHLVGGKWVIQTVEPITWLGSWAHFRSSLILDQKHLPHIFYEDAGVLKQAFWDGKQWHINVLARTGLESYRYHAVAIDKNDTIYVAFRDPEDNTLKMAVGHRSAEPQATAQKADDKPTVPQAKN
jgi:hypothetical protein